MSVDNPESPTIKVAITGEEPGIDRPEPAVDTLLVGRYRLGRRIGKGGMGEVMAARDEQVGRDVAIKRMRAANPSERAIQRFLREASVQGRLEHPAIVPVHEIGRDADNLPFFVMKKLAGTPLAKLLAEPDFDQARVLRAFVDVCLAVELAHTRGIVHRDLKPDNIMLGDFGEVYILDWGVAKVIGEEDGELADLDSRDGENETVAGTAIGTPGYMAPEQVRGLADIDGRADIYTLGCLLFEILAREPLHPRGFHGLESALRGPDGRPSQRSGRRGEVPPELDALCVQATHVVRDERVQTARELGERVQRFLDGDRDLARRRELAQDHLTRARTAFEATADHGTAMRDAAAALALDPELAGAAELVGRLMLEPPRETPPEVEALIVTDDVRTARVIAGAGLFGVVGGFLFLPLLWWMSPSSTYVPVLAGLLLVDGVIGIVLMRSRSPRPEVLLVANAIIVVILSRMFSPIMIAPGIAASLVMAMVLTPRFSRLGSSVVIAAVMTIAVLGPLVLELAGAVSQTMSVSEAGVLFHAPGLASSKTPTIIVGVVYVVALIAGAAIAGEVMRRQTRSAHLRVHLQAWQLRKLVPR
jgi:serine/threonine-protein kinase